MKTAFFIFGLFAISGAAHAHESLVVRALNCGSSTSNLERDLTTGESQGGVSGTQESLETLAQTWIKTGSFESLAGKTAVLLKPYSVISKFQSEDRLCVIYEGTVQESKTLGE